MPRILVVALLLAITVRVEGNPEANEADLASGAPEVLRSRGLTISLDGLEERLRLRLFDDVDLVAVRDALVAFGPRSYSWIGHVAGDRESSVVLARRGPALSGTVRHAGRQLRIRYRSKDNSYRVEEIAFEAAASERQPIPVNLGRPRSSKLFDDGNVLDLLVVYTPKARAAAGGAEAIEALIQLGVTETNLALGESGALPRIRLVQMREVSYQEAGDVESDLEILSRPADGSLDEVGVLRDKYGADFVQLVVEEKDGCGIAYQMTGEDPAFEAWAFSVVERDCIDSSFAVAHELGHNLGCDHAVEDPTSQGAFAYSFGYKDTVNGVRTIMAYAPGRRIPRFSNPRLSFGKFRIGTPRQDNVRSINNLRATLANFRPSLEPPRIQPPPGSTLSGVARFRFRARPEAHEWWVFVGSRPGESDLYDSGSLGGARSALVRGLPADGRPVYVRLWHRHGAVWLFDDFRYATRRDANRGGQVVAPSGSGRPGSGSSHLLHRSVETRSVVPR